VTSLDAAPKENLPPGYAAPVIGRIVQRDINGIFGLPLVKKGQTITPMIYERAEQMGRLHELVASAGS
jgi:hypothetical protein